MSSPTDIIRERSKKLISEVLRSELGIPRWLKNIEAHTLNEYHGRFLHELIQNGYDAHPTDCRSGKIAIHFDETESEYGVLYVANGGNPLSKNNFERMASIADSDKSIGVGIGNKGVGFKSVFQICDAPEVYSALDANDKAFSGYSFRFGLPEDILNLLGGDAKQAEKIEANLSLSLLTIPLEKAPASVITYRDAGYSTVIRLSASSVAAANEIRKRIDQLLSSTSPVLLFLERLELLSIQDSKNHAPIVQTRQVESAEGTFSRVILNGVQGFRIFHKAVPIARLRTAIHESVQARSLDRRWLSWDAPAHVYVALGDEDAIREGHAYTYLPMGDDAKSPLAAHINAPFVTNYARVGMNREQPVNQLLLSCIAELCLESADAIIKSSSDANTVVDLLAWHEPYLELIATTCAENLGCNFSSFVKVPTLRGEWTTLADVSVWPHSNCQVMTAEAVTQCSGADLVDPDRLDHPHMVRLVDLARRLSSSLTPSAHELASWAEDVANQLQSQVVSLDDWVGFYDDLSLLFDSGDVLASRQLLLTEDGTLAPCNEQVEGTPTSSSPGRRRRTVFFSPQAPSGDDGVDSDRDIKAPRSLKNRIVFMHPELPWYQEAQRRPGRDFLEDKRLVQPFRTERLLSLLSRVVSNTRSSPVKRDALIFAFRLFAKDPARHAKELAAVGLEVPTAQGSWVSAKEARFSHEWPVEGAKELATVTRAATSSTPDLAQIRDVLLEHPNAIASSPDLVPQWCIFLGILGVSSRLPIRSTSDVRRLSGRQLTAPWIAGDDAPAGMPREVVDQWRLGILGGGNDRRANTPFVTRDSLYWFAGQHEVHHLPGKLRSVYAELVTQAMPFLRTDHWVSTWRTERASAYSTQIATPLAAFLKHSPWVPIARPGTDKRDFVPPPEAWYVTVEDHMAASYSSLVEPSLRRRLDQLPNADTHRNNLGFKIWGSSDDVAALINLLTTIFAAGDLPDTASAHFRSTLSHAWSQIGGSYRRILPHITKGLLVERSGQIELVQLDNAGEEPVFVTSASDQSATARLVRELGWPYITVDTEDLDNLRRIASFVLRGYWPGELEVTSDWNLEVLTNGNPWIASESVPRLSEEIPWLPHIIACTMRFPRGSGLRVGKQLSRTLEEIARLRLLKSESIAVRTSAGERSLPEKLHGVLPLPGEPPTLLMEDAGSPLTWSQLESITQGVLELLGHTRFTAELSLTLRTLSGNPSNAIFRPENTEIADALGAPLIQIEETEKLVSGAVVGVTEKLRRVAVCLWGEDSLDKLHPHPSLTKDDLLNTVTGLCDGDRDKAKDIIELATDLTNADALRRRLNVSVKDYNESLVAYFPSTRMIDNGPTQQEEFNIRRGHRRSELIDAVRARRVARFRRGEPQDDWQELRDLSFLQPNASWATTQDDLGNELIDHIIDQQLEQRLGEAPNPFPPLEDWEQVRWQNGKPLRQKLTSIERILTAWYYKKKRTPDIPSWGEAFVETTHQHLDRVGALDFTMLDEDALLQWLVRLNIWPDDMESTTNFQRLGLTHEDMDAAKSEQELARDAKRRADRQVNFDGHVVDLEPSMSNWVATLRDQLSSLPSSLDTRYQSAQLEDMAVTGARTRGSGGSSSRGLQSSRLSDAQRTAIGLAGEYAAFQWLRAKVRSPAVDETCWKSASVAYFFDGITGDDGLGYDFEVPRKNGSTMYEVKATSVDAGTIELGETEVACAQEHARNERWRLLIVENALSREPRIHMLPNPFHRNSRSQFSFVGNSVRLRFSLKN